MVHRVSFFSHAYHYLLFATFLIIDSLTGVRWYLIIVLVYIYLMIKDVSIFLFACWSPICIHWKMSMKFLCSILIELFVGFFCCCLFLFDVEVCEFFVYFKYWVLVRYIVNIFSSISVLTSFLMVFLFTMKRFLVWCEVKVTQLCLTLDDLMDYTVHAILQVRILEWVAFPLSGFSLM